jgi:BirA family biotin operon repressor/biotin-[acetyl-CoA-carboxylase] ligase
MSTKTFLVGVIEHHYVSISSTHRRALALLSEGDPKEGTTISTDFQLNGEGQGRNNWHSEPNKNVLCSVIARPVFLPADELFKLHLLASLAVVQVLEDTGLEDVRIKWPNDVLVNNDKIAGILIHNQIAASMIRASVVSFGLNVNQERFPDELIHATSIRNVTGKSFSVRSIKYKLYRAFEHYFNLVQKDPDGLRVMYLKKLVGYDETCKLMKSDGQIIQAKIHNILYSGSILAETDDGSVQFSVQDVKMIYN